MSKQNKRPESHQKLFDSILSEVPEFDSAVKTDGTYIRSSTANNGFEFSVGIQPNEKIHFQYVARSNPTTEQYRHATFVRDYLGMGGGNTDKYAAVNYYDNSLTVDNVNEVIESLKKFLYNTTVTSDSDKMLQRVLM